ncbi:MAG: MFS transporter, partial [Chloroflexi bacterium]|nr:MFS transporter [Chloroflexota bacterium]
MSERLPRRTRVLYAAGSVSGSAVSQAFTLWLIYFYAPPGGADLATRVPDIAGIDARIVLGVVLTAARLIEAVDDPLIGYWSDRTRSRWGRRVPFIVLGTPWWVLCFVLLFTPPAATGAGLNLVYLFVVLQAYFLLANLSGAPFEALLPNIARRPDDRVSIATWQVVFGVTGAVVGLSLSSLLRAFVGFQAMAISVAAIALIARYVALAGCLREARADRDAATPGFMLALRTTWSNRQFLAFLPSFVLFQVGLQMLTALLPFFVDAVLQASRFLGFSGETDSGIFSFLLTAAVIGGMLAGVPIFARLARRRGKAAAYRIAMLWAAAYFPLIFFAGFVPGVPRLAQAFAA